MTFVMLNLNKRHLKITLSNDKATLVVPPAPFHHCTITWELSSHIKQTSRTVFFMCIAAQIWHILSQKMQKNESTLLFLPGWITVSLSY